MKRAEHDAWLKQGWYPSYDKNGEIVGWSIDD